MSADAARGAPPVMVIGLGRFGTSVARSLTRMGHEVLGVDQAMEVVQSMSEELTHVVQADTTNPAALRKLGAGEMAHAVVGIGSDIEASVLTVVALADAGCRDIWAKAVNANHGRILERVGAAHVIYPEAEMGERVAHLVTGKMMDFIEFDDGFAIVKMRPPQEAIGFTLEQSQIRSKYGVTVVGVKAPGQDFTYAVPSTKVSAHDTLIVSGATSLLERLAARP